MAGSTVVGVADQRRFYLPYGAVSLSTVAVTNPAPDTKGWIGERFDADAGLQYLNARYYDPQLGMFLQPDWWEVMRAGVGTNRFSYSFGDPVNGIDPTGHLTYDTRKNIFTANKGDSLSTIARSMGITNIDMMRANKGVLIDTIIRAGTLISIPRNNRINVGTAAAKLIGSNAYSKDADRGGNAPSGSNKCNLFVGDMVRSGFGDNPEYQRLKGRFKSYFYGQPEATMQTLPASARDWSLAARAGMKSVSVGNAVFGDVGASDNGLLSYIPTQLGGASGHATIFTSDVSIIDQTGSLHNPDGGWGTVGAGERTVNFRSADYLSAEGYTLNFTRYGD